MEIIDGEVVATSIPTKDGLKNIKWKTKEGDIIPISQVDDRHLRNIALFLIGMGYQKCMLPDSKRVIWLTIVSMEWERRQLSKTWIVDMNNREDLVTSTTPKAMREKLLNGDW